MKQADGRLVVPIPELGSFYEANPEFDLRTFDFYDAAAVSRLHWPADVEGASALELLKAHQRVLRVHANPYLADALTRQGFDSANRIAALAEDQFVARTADIFGGDMEAAREAHRKAATIKAQTMHLWANVHSVVASSHARRLRGDNVSDEVVDFFTSLPTYRDLFGTLDYCVCEHCKSIFGPAAYFVDLMRITQRYITEPNEATIPPDMTLKARRKGLFEMPLTCGMTNDLVPYLQIVNQVLADRAEYELQTADVFHFVANTLYPFNLPVNIFLGEIRIYLGLLETSLAEIYTVFAPTSKEAAAREALGLSIEQLHIVTTPTPQEAPLKTYYGLTTQSLSDLDVEEFFRLQTTLAQEELESLLYENLNAAERAAGLPHQFFFNLLLPAEQFVTIISPTEGPRKLTNLTLETLDRINRFVRLARWMEIAFADLSWLLHSAGAAEISEATIQELAVMRLAQTLYGLPTDVMAAFWSDMKTIGIGTGQYPEDLFDRVYNNPSLLKGTGPYHPVYAENPLYTDPVVVWKVDDRESDGESFGRPRLMAALGISDTQLTALGEALFGVGAEVALNVPNLSYLYRTVQVMKALGLSLEDYLALLGLLTLEQREATEPGSLILLKSTVDWLRASGLSVADANYILTGQTGSTSTVSMTPVEYNFMKTVWVLNQEGLITPASFTSDQITAEASEAAFDALLAMTDPQVLVSVREAYQLVFKKPLQSDVAIVLQPVTAEALAALRDLGFSAKQVQIIADTLTAAYTAQLELLNTQLATLYGVDTGVLGGLWYYAGKVVPPGPMLQLLLTPVTLADESWQAIVDLFKEISRAVFAAVKLRLSGAELINMADHPAAYGITSPLDLDLGNLHAITGLKALETAYGDSEQAWLNYLAMPSDSDCASGEKAAALSALTAWPQDQICRIAADLGEGPSIYDTIDGINQLKRGFDILSRSGMDAFFISNLLRLRDLTAESEENWLTYEETAKAVLAIANARYPETWEQVNGQAVSKLGEQRRDSLQWLVLWKLRQKYPPYTTLRHLYEFLLIDVEMSGCAEISYIAEGMNAVQLYMQRCRLHLEVGVDVLPIPAVWWEWMTNYRIWEANRKIFLYPENYLIPSLRQSRTELFKKLQESLQQSDYSESSVESAFRSYLDGLASLATLTYVDAYQCTVEDAQSGAVETTFLFSRTRAEPYSYYYCSREKGGYWSEWKPIDITITSQYITPVYVFSRLFVFWVDLTQVSSSEIKSNGEQGTASKNQFVYSAAIRYSFYDFTGNWVTPQTLFEEQVAFVAPSTTPFNDASGYQLFNMQNLYWQKANAVRVTPENLVGLPMNTAPTEKLTILYGPFLDNNVTGSMLTVPPPPLPAEATANPALYKFDLNVYNRTLDNNQAAQGSTRGPIPLQTIRTINNDLNFDFLMRSTEFFLFRDNRAAGIPPAVTPRIDVPLSTLTVAATLNPLRTNYYGDYTADISSARPPQPVTNNAFVSPGINATGSSTVYNDLLGHYIIDAQGTVSPLFSLNTDLSFLFSGAPPETKATLTPIVQEVLLACRAASVAVTEQSFVVSEITQAASQQVFNDLKAFGIINATNYVSQYFSSRTDLSFLFGGAPPREKQLLISEVQRVLFAFMGDPTLLEAIAKENASTIMVKNQPGSFIFNNGDEAFLVEPETVQLPPLSSAMQVYEIQSQATVYTYSFVTPDIDMAGSDQVYKDLLGHGIINAQGQVTPFFTARTDLSFLFAGASEPQRSLLIAEVREILLNLPSITGLSYYFEDDDFIITDESFITYGIDAAASAEVNAQLRAHGIVGPDGIISKTFTPATDLSFLFPDEESEALREVLIAEVRQILLSYYAGVWQRNIHDLYFRFYRLTTGAVPRLSRSLFAGGIDRLLALKSQQIPVVPEMPFSRYLPTFRAIAPQQFDGAQVDFDGPYGLYYWELFFYSVQLIAADLLAQRRFEDALSWLQYVFNPTIREQPLGPDSFITPDITRDQSAQAYAQLQEAGIITSDGEVAQSFNESTYLGFLWPEVPPGPKKDLMIREVRNVLLNAQVSKPSARYWQFQPFRNYRLESLQEILTDPVQIAIYNNHPFDPYAIARLRIGAFEKAIFMSYLDTLLAWGDALFSQYTWESVSAATMLYMYAYNLLGDRPINTGPCPSQPPTNFEKILEKYESAPGGIPQFLIDMENLIPGNDIVAPGMLGQPFNEVDAYFCVPENQQMMAYWDRVDDRLYKIRNCLDLEGKPLELPLFAPPINPLDLVRAAAAGRSALTVVEQQQASIPVYRFNYMISHARMLVSGVMSLGSSLFSALSGRDAEALSRLRARQEFELLSLTTALKTAQVESAQRTVESLQESLKAIQARQEFYTKLAAEFMSPAEIASLIASAIALRFRVLAGATQAVSSIAFSAPQVGSPFAITYGGMQVGNTLEAAGQVLETMATVADFAAQTSLTIANYQRRAQEWEMQAQQASIEAAQVQKQIAGAQVQVQMANLELMIHQKDVEQAKEVQSFLNNKFDSQEMYSWMVSRLSTLYFQAYKLALDAALATQSAYRWELNRDDNFINFDYWDNLRHGLLAGEALDTSLSQMERAFVQNNARRLEIRKSFSLAASAPQELLRLKETGECSLIFSEAMFDFDFPGHYCRQVKGVEVSLYLGDGGPGEMHAELTQIRNDLVTAPSIEAVRYLVDGGAEPPLTIRRDWQSRQQVALSYGDLDSGVFDFYFSEDRYLPFEGTGAVSEWLLSMPKDTNRIDYNLITDVVVRLSYTALNGGRTFRDEVKGVLKGERYLGMIYFNLAESFPEDWAAFMEDHALPDTQTLSFPIASLDVPPNLKNVTLTAVDFQLDVGEGVTMPATSQFMSLKIVEQADRPITLTDRFGRLQTQLTVDQFTGDWLLTVDLATMRSNPALQSLLIDGYLDPEKFRNLEIILQYQACVYGCS